MEGNTFSLYSLLIVTSLALIVPLVVSRIRSFRIPIVVGEILVGVIVGKSGFNIIVSSDWLKFLEFFGLAYLMFISGLEIDLRALLPNRELESKGFSRLFVSTPVFSLVTTALTFVMATGLSWWLFLHHFIKSPLLVALIITTTSLTVVVPVLKEYDLLGNPYGQLLLGAAVMADFATMLLISVAASLYQGGFSPSVLLVLVLIFILVLLYFVFRRFSGIVRLRSLAHGTAQLGIRASLALMIVFIVLSQTLGVQVILGTFLAGVFVGLVNDRERSDVYHKLDAIGFGFLIPIFFIMIGVNFDIHSLLADPKALLLLPVLWVATYLFKAIPALLLRLAYPWRQTLAGAALLTTQMSVTVAAAAVGRNIGAISPGVDTAIVLVAMLTSVVSPVLFGKLLPRRTDQAKRQFVLVGNAPEVKLLSDQMQRQREEFQWINTKTVDLHHPQPLKQLGINPEETKALVVYSTDDMWNVELSTIASRCGIGTIICGIRDLYLFNRYNDSNAFVAVHPTLSEVTLIDQLMHVPMASRLLQSPDLKIQEIHVDSRLLNQRRIMDLKLPGTLLIFSIVRDGTQLVPHGQTTLHAGDTLVVVGTNEDVDEFRRMASGSMG
ncbi:cation:proton antiporter [Alicyclobacillus tolerans]|uniref:cation:proton antiporter domain-containing protein n=1 Tax=Alicyclobacillus tolerans TaxID=90970 RepID=UPI001F02BA53|nr:cation:proton antiporter [Alicyclobacillus tolerans]MCF8566171.1 cation:proton antiporter [Alicyclobacillus tolerans]